MIIKEKEVFLGVYIYSILLVIYSLIAGCSGASMKGASRVADTPSEPSRETEIPSGIEYLNRVDVKKMDISEHSKPMDILLVMDPTKSMVQYRFALGFQLPKLVHKLGSDKDWRIAVTYTTPSSDTTGSHKGCVELDQEGKPYLITSEEYKNDPEGTMTKLERFISGYYNTSSYSEGLFKILEAMDLVNVETYNKVHAKKPSYVIADVQNVLNPQQYQDKRCNGERKWFRDNANLSIIILSNNDQGGLSTQSGESSGRCLKYIDDNNSYIRSNTGYSNIMCSSSYATGVAQDKRCINLLDDASVRSFVETFKGISVREHPKVEGASNDGDYYYATHCLNPLTCLGNYLIDVPKEERCVSIVDIHDDRAYYNTITGEMGTEKVFNIYLGKVRVRTFGTAPLTSYHLGMTQRKNSEEIFSDYISTLNKNVKIYGILHKNVPDKENYDEYGKYNGIDRAFIYKNVIKRFGNYPTGNIEEASLVCNECQDQCVFQEEYNEVYVEQCRTCQEANPGCTGSYEELLDSISTNIEKYLTVKEIRVSSIPERITDISLGKLDQSGNFIEIKNVELGKNIFQKSGRFELEPGFDLEGSTHIQIRYNSVK